MNLWVIAFPFLMYLASVGTYLSSPRTPATLKANVDNVVTGILSTFPRYTSRSGLFYTAYVSLSLSLNILLTLTIVVRIVLHGRNVRAATGSSAGISGLYKTIATMLIESSTLFAASSLLVLVPWGVGSPISGVFSPTLSKTQVRAFPRLRSLDEFNVSYVTTEWIGHRFTAHRSTSRQQERVN